MTIKKLSVNDYILNNFWFIKTYFERAIRNEKLLIYEDFADEAKEAFKRLPASATEDGAIIQWSDWISKYVSSEKWESCKTATRQHRLVQRKRYQYKTFRIPSQLSYDIGYYASITGLSKFAAMQQAINAAIKTLHANGHKVIGSTNNKEGKIINK